MIDANASGINPSCHGGHNGTATVTSVTGGAGGYSYLWSNGNTTAADTGLASGNYSVTISDRNNCTNIQIVPLNDPSLITPVLNVTQPTCRGGNDGLLAITSITGGTGGYSYNWSTGSSSFSISNLGSGTYSVTVTDANLCTVESSASLIPVSPLTFQPPPRM